MQNLSKKSYPLKKEATKKISQTQYIVKENEREQNYSYCVIAKDIKKMKGKKDLSVLGPHLHPKTLPSCLDAPNPIYDPTKLTT